MVFRRCFTTEAARDKVIRWLAQRRRCHVSWFNITDAQGTSYVLEIRPKRAERKKTP